MLDSCITENVQDPYGGNSEQKMTSLVLRSILRYCALSPSIDSLTPLIVLLLLSKRLSSVHFCDRSLLHVDQVLPLKRFLLRSDVAIDPSFRLIRFCLRSIFSFDPILLLATQRSVYSDPGCLSSAHAQICTATCI